MMLEPHLRPGTPDPNSSKSMQIYSEHIKAAEELLKVTIHCLSKIHLINFDVLQVQTKLSYAERQREKLLSAMTPERKKMQTEILQKIKAKDELLKLRKDLEEQMKADPKLHQQYLEKQRNAESAQTPTDDGWVVLPK